ncbi:hypothetical protein CHARACLAT_019470 [Characodon lateralis]|uniref:Uncharacterized protein n=1 Tax=Characodon lateralis TaxID=208331 RepID=A0ABU7EB64_9TELE|nr:hypothetical protein [Characodon lateralis]
MGCRRNCDPIQRPNWSKTTRERLEPWTEGSRPLLTVDPPVDSVRTTAVLALRVSPCSEQMFSALAAGSTQETRRHQGIRPGMRHEEPARDCANKPAYKQRQEECGPMREEGRQSDGSGNRLEELNHRGRTL